jgi:hypothetical protein
MQLADACLQLARQLVVLLRAQAAHTCAASNVPDHSICVHVPVELLSFSTAVWHINTGEIQPIQ